jgi:hypothetical protein
MNFKQTIRTAAVALLALTAFPCTERGVSHRCRLHADEKEAVKRDDAWVDKRIKDWQPTKAERAFDEIGWAKSLIEAQQLAEKHGRPIFLFTYDGADLACYRC